MNSKIRFLLLASSLSFGLLTVPGVPAGESPNAAEPDQAKPHDEAAFWGHLATARKATELIGLTVNDRPGHLLGKIADFLVDLGSGREVCALILPPGDDALNGYIPVPAPALFVAGRMLTLTADNAILADIPRLSPGVTDPAELGKAAVHAYAYFNLKYAREDQAAAVQLWKASRLLSRKIKNKTGDTFGSLANLWLDVRSGHIFFAIGTLDGTEKNVYAVPPAALTVDREQPALWIDANRTKIAQASNSDGFFWTSLVDPAWGAGVYRTYGQTPNAEPLGENINAGASAKAGAAAPAPLQPAGPTDAEINGNVMTALARSGLGDAAYKNVAVMTSLGQVTLQGKVRSEALKQKVAAVVESVAGPGKVNNLLQIGR